jgi:hypothetical protein
MTRNIRAALEGVVHTYLADGSEGPVLSAGDTVPDDVMVGDHLTDAAATDDTDDHQPPADPKTDGARSDVPADDEDADDEGEGENADGDGDGENQDGLEKPAGNARTEEWEQYADAIGVEYDEGAGRDEIRAAVAAYEAAEHEG